GGVAHAARRRWVCGWTRWRRPATSESLGTSLVLARHTPYRGSVSPGRPHPGEIGDRTASRLGLTRDDDSGRPVDCVKGGLLAARTRGVENVANGAVVYTIPRGLEGKREFFHERCGRKSA